MNQPTREEFEHLKEKVRKLEEQITEPIKITRLEIDSGSMHKRLDVVQEDVTVLKEDAGVLKEEMKGARADIVSIKATQSDHSAFLVEHGQRLSAIETKQDTHTEILGKLMDLVESHDKRFDRIEKIQNEQGTKLDEQGTKLDEQGTKLDEQGTKLDEIAETQRQILQLLQIKGE